MNKLKNTLLCHFNDRDNKYMVSDVVLIILSYCTPYYEPTPINIYFKQLGCADPTGSSFHKEIEYIQVVKGLTNNRVAFGLYNGRVYVLNLLNSRYIVTQPIILSEREKKHVKNFVENSIKFTRQSNYDYYYEITTQKNIKLNVKVSKLDNPIQQDDQSKNRFLSQAIYKICQVDDNTLVYTMKRDMNIYIWDFENDKTSVIYNDVIGSDVVLLRRNVIAFTTMLQYIKILNLNTLEMIIINYVYHYPQILVFNDKIVLHSKMDDYPSKTYIEVIDKNDFESGEWKGTYYEKIGSSWDYIKIIPCANTVDDLFSEKYVTNNIIYVEYEGRSNVIKLHNIDAQKIINVKHSIQNTIVTTIYLNNGYMAILTEKEIIIYSFVLKSIIQTITNGYNKYVSMHMVSNGKFILIDEDSKVTLYN